MGVYEISGNFRISIESESKVDALEKLDEIKFIDVDRIDINDVVEY